MKCYNEFPLSTVIYNLVTLGGALVVGVVVVAQFGSWATAGYLLLLALTGVGLLLAGLVPHLWLVCGHCCQGVIFRAIMGHVLSPKVGQGFSPKVGHLFSPKGGHSLSPKLGHDGAGEIPRHRAYFPLSNQREWEGTCLERGKKPWIFEKY